MLYVDSDNFTRLVEEALEALPAEFKAVLDNVAVVVEEYPTPEQKRTLHLRHGSSLFGLYEGIPQGKRTNYSMVLPDKITIFQKPIEAFCETEEAIKEQVRKTVLHEIGHHLGMNDKTLKKLRY